MNFFKHTIIIFLVSCAAIFAEELPSYRMVDLGVFGTDQSQAIAVNEKGQVLGTFEENGATFLFLWDETNGLYIIDQPAGTYFWNLKLNNNGQIAGTAYSGVTATLFCWDRNLGLWQMESLKNQFHLVGFNDKGQILCLEGDQLCLWDNGEKTNLTKIFREEMGEDWSYFQPVCINSQGHVAFVAYKHQGPYWGGPTPILMETIATSCIIMPDTWGTKSFIWKDGSLKTVMPEKGWETCVNLLCMDDDGKMIVSIYPRDGVGSHHTYFISSSGKAEVAGNCNTLRNGLPIAIYCLPGQLKKDSQGQAYYTAGIEIKKLLKDEYPYYNVANTTDVRDQNSKGYVVGQIGTMYPGSHAFLAIPNAEPPSN